jgi:PAS domain S-box-containing protein
MLARGNVLREVQKLTLFDLPIGVYVVTEDGYFVECNNQVREILGLSTADLTDRSIKEFYLDPSQREEILRGIREVEDRGRWMEATIPLNVAGVKKYIEDYTRSIRNDKDDIIGYVCCMVDVTKEEHYKRLFMSLPVGVYQLNERDEFSEVNTAFVNILGYSSAEEIIGRHVKDLYVNPEESDELRKLVTEKGSEVNYKAELRRRDGESIFVAVSAHKLVSSTEKYAGREGTIMDITTEERYRRILEDVPVGLYELYNMNGQDRISHCNTQFATIFEFDSPEKVIGFDARKLFASTGDYASYVNALEMKSNDNAPLQGYALNVVSRKGRSGIFEVNSRPIKDRKGNMIGRAGAIRDITEEATLRDKVTEFTYDFGRVLHDYTSTLLMVQHSIDPVIQSLSPDPFGDSQTLSPDKTDGIIAEPARQLALSLNNLLELAKSEERAAVLPDSQWTLLTNLLDSLQNYEEQIPLPDIRPLVLADAALKVLNVCADIHSKFSKELLRQLRSWAQELIRLTNLLSLHQAQSAILEMDHQVRSLREYVTSDSRIEEPTEVCKISTLLADARRNLDKFAMSRGVRFDIKKGNVDPLVKVVRRDLVRVIANLLHNAIKYSWNRAGDKLPWISVRTFVDSQQACLQVENWGVPIEKEELEQELIFHIGYRGRQSSDRGRVGTGIGLTDARRVARKHGGDLTVSSHPAVFSKRDDDYAQPFITTVVLKLPTFEPGDGETDEN